MRLAFYFITLATLSACTTFEYHETENVPISKLSDEQEAAIDEELLLDVGVVLFEHGVDELDDEAAAYANVRKSEAVWFTSQLKTTLDRSNAWGPEVNLPGDPFQALFNRIANDLFDYRAGLDATQLRAIRSTTKVLFARDFVPAAFDSYVAQDEQGRASLLRIPAADDPLMKKVDRIRARNDLFLDVIQDYYRAFNNTMSVPYQEWRKLSYKEVLLARQLKEQARKERIAGIAVIAGGVAAANSSRSRTTRVGGLFGAGYGARIFANSFAKQNQALGHSETLRELGSSLELELEPSVVDLQDRSITLSGTVDDQYQEWRRILSRMFEINEGGADEDLPADATQQAPSPDSNDDSQASISG